VASCPDYFPLTLPSPPSGERAKISPAVSVGQALPAENLL
jgi:hypothetical protein